MPLCKIWNPLDSIYLQINEPVEFKDHLSEKHGNFHITGM